MASEAFKRWAQGFDSRHRFSIPLAPPNPQPKESGTVPPTIVVLPPRSGSMRFSDEDVTAVIELLRQCETGQAVRLTDAADDSDNTARRRAELMKEQITAKVGKEPLKPGHKIRGHVLTAGDPTTETHKSEKSGKEYKLTHYPENWAAVSLIPESEDDSPAAEDKPAEDKPKGKDK